MTAELPAVCHSFHVGKRTCTLTIPQPKTGGVASIVVEWSPSPPRRLSRREFRQYREGRDAAIAELAEKTGLRAKVVEI